MGPFLLFNLAYFYYNYIRKEKANNVYDFVSGFSMFYGAFENQYRMKKKKDSYEIIKKYGCSSDCCKFSRKRKQHEYSKKSQY